MTGLAPFIQGVPLIFPSLPRRVPAARLSGERVGVSGIRLNSKS